MNISPTNNSNCFKGKLSPKVTKQIKKIQKKDICCLVYDNNCNRKLTSEDAINTINVHAKFIIRTLEKVANLLPQKAKICLKEEHNGSVYIQGKFSDKYTKYNFRIFKYDCLHEKGKITDNRLAFLNEDCTKIEYLQNIKNSIFNNIKYSIVNDIKKGKIKTKKTLQKRYDYYKKEFPNIEFYKTQHLELIQYCKEEKKIKQENNKYLPLKQRILAKLGF